MNDADEEKLEQRLLTDAAFAEEFDTAVDDLTDQYLENELEGAERERVEKYFLSTAERQQKLEFASELLRHAALTRDPNRTTHDKPGLWKQFLEFWKQKPLVPLAASAAVLVIVIGIAFVVSRNSQPGKTSYAAFTLTINASDRASGAAPAQLKMPAAGLMLDLTIPEQSRGAKDYRAKLVNADGVARALEIDERKSESVKVAIPSGWLTRGSYAIQLSAVKADGSEERIRGSYLFDIE